MTRTFWYIQSMAICSVMLLAINEINAQTGVFESTELIGRPTDSSITVQAIATASLDVYFEYGTESGNYTDTTLETTFPGGMVEVTIDALLPNTRYYYRMLYRITGDADWITRDEHTFHTQRAPNSAFTFTVQSDSHQGFTAFHNAALYTIALANQAMDQPDFQFDLGDTFSLDDQIGEVSTEDEASVRIKHINQRATFDDLCHSAALFLVPGNHENEELWNLDDYGSDVQLSLPVLGTNARKRYFLNPIPDDFYTGNLDDALTALDGDHLKEDYFAFEWGSALFVSIDPYWYTAIKPFEGGRGGELEDETEIGDRWSWTLGEAQYQWLKETLENSDAPFKFVFAHHTTAGIVDYGHGGVDGAAYCEWGGHNYPEMDPNESWAFHQYRPGWELPIHQMMAMNGVTIFFHGHDHVFAREELDGVIYLEMPHTAHSGYATGFDMYSDPAEVINNSGHVRVTVSESEVTFEYIRAFLPENETAGSCDLNDYINCRKNGEVYYTETVSAPTPNDQPSAQDDQVEIQENSGQVIISVLDNDTDPNGDPITVVGVSQPDNGITEKAAPGDTTVRYTPNPDYCGASPDVFSYVVSDGFGRTDSATVTVTAICINDPPVTTDDNAFTSPGEALVIPVLDNDSDPEGNIDPASVTIASPPTNGSAVPAEAGTVAYTPNVGFTGVDTFEYEVCDTESLCASATVTVSVFEEPQPKLEFTSVVVGNDFVTVQLEDTYVSPVVVCSAQYANNTTPVVVRVDNAVFNSFDIWLQNPSNAPVTEETVHCLVVEEGIWTIDGVAIEAQKYNSTVTNTASTWIGEPQNYGQNYVQPVVVGQVMSANDDAWSAFYARGATRTDPPSASALVTGKMVGEDTLTERADETVGFVVIEAGHHTIAGTELAAALGDDTVAGATDSPPYVYTLPSTLGEAPVGAVVSLAGMDGTNGGWTQLHGTSPLSTSSMALSIDEDQIGDSERAHTTEQVAYLVFCPTNTPNQSPTAQDQSVVLEEDGSLPIVLTGLDPDGDPLTFVVLTQPQHGALSGSGDTFTYTPETDYNGDDSFSFSADDGAATSAPATVSIVVNPVNDNPVAKDIFIDTIIDTPVDIVSPATDADGDPLDYVVETPINGGQVIVDGETIHYTPASGYCGLDVFDYIASDGNGASDTGIVSVEISCLDNDPVAVADNTTVQSGETVVIDVVSNDHDLDGDLDFSTVEEDPGTPVIGGTLSNLGNGLFEYAASTDFSGTDYFDYTICDSVQHCATATVTIEVTAAPRLLEFVTVTADNTPQTVTLGTAYNPTRGCLLGTIHR